MSISRTLRVARSIRLGASSRASKCAETCAMDGSVIQEILDLLKSKD